MATAEGNSGANSAQNLGGAVGCCCVVTFFVLVFTLPFVLYTMPDTERGVVYSQIFAEFGDEILESGGIHRRPYNADVILWPRTEETVEFGQGRDRPVITCNSNDGLLISIDISFQYFPNQEDLLELTRDYQTFENWRNLMIQQVESTVRDTCGDFVADDFQSNRGAVTLAMESNTRESVSERFRGVLTKFQVVNLNRPNAYEGKVREKENARSEITLAQNERNEAVINAQIKVDAARQEAERLLDSANTTAQITLAQANATAEATLDRFQRLAEIYRGVKESRGMGNANILTYIANEIFHDDVTIAVDAPVRINYREDL